MMLSTYTSSVAKLFALFLLFLIYENARAQVWEGDYLIETQADVDNFTTDCACTEITGVLHISGYANSGIVHLDGLSNLTSVGYLFITDHEHLINIDGLSNLTFIQGSLHISNNYLLTSIDGLNNLNFIGEYLWISSNLSLTNIDGLINLVSVGGVLMIQVNPALINIDGLSNLSSVTEDLRICNNILLQNINGLTSVISVGKSLHIHNSPLLTNIDGLSNVTSIGRYLNIHHNPLLTNLNGLSNITSIGKGVDIRDNGNLNTCCIVEHWRINNVVQGNYYIGITENGTIAPNASGCNSLAEIQDNCTVQVKFQVLLTGAYNQTAMNTYLQANNLLPLQQPYAAHPSAYDGTEQVNAIPDNVVDWVLVEVRDANDWDQLIEKRAVFLRNDGLLIDIDGSLNVHFFNLDENSSYYFIIRHRNHLDVMSSQPLAVNNVVPHDFTNPNNILGGDSQLSYLEERASFGLKAGDINGDGIINVADVALINNEDDLLNTYQNTDCNLDGNITTADFNEYLPNASAIGVPQIRY